MSVKSNNKTDFSDLPLHEVVAIVANTILVAKEAYPEQFKVLFTPNRVGVLVEGVTYKDGNIVVANSGK